MAKLTRRILIASALLASSGLLLSTRVVDAQNPDSLVGPVTETAEATPAAPLPRLSAPAQSKPAFIKLSPGDLIAVSVDGVSDYRPETRVSQEGVISLPLIGDVAVGGLTTEQAQDEIAKKMRDGNYFRDPHVSVFVKEYASIGISVLGEVSHPGVYPSLGTRRLYDVISAAGGFSARAGKTVTITHRDHPEQPVIVTVDADPARSVDSNVQVFPGDTIMVSKAGLVYVVGDVGRPGGFIMDNNEHITVLQALALAQGVNRSAALGSARIIRKTSGGPKEVPVPLKRMMAAKATDMDMQPEDILFIPGSAAKNIVKRTAESVMQAATGVAIYGVH
ncbi:MAG TPA: polysaccharide biosynthesis/export family protein [Terriglobales bacterium]|nr:polysaccharide biosynthesis/export family protein [Terriglobales bacterium]